MFRHFPLVALFGSGCIIYDDVERCKDHECDEIDVGDDTAGLSVPDPSFSIDPSEVEAGSTFIATVTAENFDLSTVESVEVFGPASLLAQQNRGEELILSVTVDASALVADEVDILLHVGSDVLLIEAAITVNAEAPDTGHDDDCE